jgi:hypothetical protein
MPVEVMGEMRNECRYSVGKTKEKKAFGRPGLK